MKKIFLLLLTILGILTGCSVSDPEYIDIVKKMSLDNGQTIESYAIELLNNGEFYILNKENIEFKNNSLKKAENFYNTKENIVVENLENASSPELKNIQWAIEGRTKKGKVLVVTTDTALLRIPTEEDIDYIKIEPTELKLYNKNTNSLVTADNLKIASFYLDLLNNYDYKSMVENYNKAEEIEANKDNEEKVKEKSETENSDKEILTLPEEEKNQNEMYLKLKNEALPFEVISFDETKDYAYVNFIVNENNVSYEIYENVELYNKKIEETLKLGVLYEEIIEANKNFKLYQITNDNIGGLCAIIGEKQIIIADGKDPKIAYEDALIFFNELKKLKEIIEKEKNENIKTDEKSDIL